MDNEGDAKRLLLANDGQFIPENDIEEIWKEPNDRCTKNPGDNVSIKPEEFEPTMNYLPASKKKHDHRKATENPLFRRKIAEKQDAVIPEGQEQSVEPAKDVEEDVVNDVEMQTRPRWVTVFLVSSCFINSMYNNLGNRCVWNILMVIIKVLVAVFVYMVLACAAIIVTVLINSHDAINTRRVKFQIPDGNENKNTADDKEVEEIKRLPQTSVSKVKIKGL